MEKKNLALFDFDGTISFKDSLLEFIKFRKGKRSFYINMMLLVPFFVLMKLGVLSNHRVKELVLSWFFKGEKKESFLETSKAFSRQVIPKIIKQDALDCIYNHLNNGDLVVVVSATMDVWLQDWCDSLGLELISSRLKFENDIFTGKLATPNCSGQEKVKRVKDSIPLENYQTIYAYGNSGGDKPMLNMADKSFYKNF